MPELPFRTIFCPARHFWKKDRNYPRFYFRPKHKRKGAYDMATAGQKAAAWLVATMNKKQFKGLILDTPPSAEMMLRRPS